MTLATYAAYAACVYTARWKGGMALAQRTLPVYTQRDGREEWHLRSARCLCIHSAMEGRNDACAAHAAYIYTARWKGGMALATCAARAACVYTARWKGGMTLATCVAYAVCVYTARWKGGIALAISAARCLCI